MSGFTDHLKNKNPETLVLEVAFGTHIIAGDLAKSFSDGTDVYVQHLLGDALGYGWKGVGKGAWFLGLRIADENLKFYPGLQSAGMTDPVQGVDERFELDTPHSNTAWLRFKVPDEVKSNYLDNAKNPPEGLRLIADCQTGSIYDASGAIISTGQFLTNAADVAAFLCKTVRRYPNSRINFASLAVLRTLFNQTETPEWTTLPEGVGLTGKYYAGTNFETFVTARIDPVVEFNNSAGSPSYNVPVDNYSVRWEGKVRPRYTETYTFYLTHDDGGRLYVTNMTTPVIDNFVPTPPVTDSATIALTADQYYDIKVEWNEASVTSEVRLEWESANQAREVVPQERLYPKAEAVKKYECHAKFTQETSFDEALKLVLQSSNAFYQEADGRLNFYSFDTLASSFTFNADNIVSETFRAEMRYSQTEMANQPTRYQASGLDLDSQYLEQFSPVVYFDIENGNVGTKNGHIRTETIDVGNTRRWQAYKILRHAAKLKAQGWILSFEAMPSAFSVLAGDLVTFDFRDFNETFLVLEATDKSIDAGADERIFKLFQWSID